EWRTDRLPFDRRADLAEPGFSLLVRRRGSIVLRTRNGILLDEALHPLEVHTRELQLRFRAGQLRLLLSRIELHEDVSLLDSLPGVKGDAVDDTGKVGADCHALD